MRIVLYAYTDRGRELKARLQSMLEKQGELVLELAVEEAFSCCDALIFIGATGIAVRRIAPLVRDKFQDPAVLSMDELGRHCISLLSGHVGGANLMAERIAGMIGAEAVISTATDLNHLFAVDLFAKENALWITDRVLARKISAALLRGVSIGFCSDFPVEGELPGELYRAEKREIAAGQEALSIAVTLSDAELGGSCLRLIPRCLSLGVGCRRGIAPETLREALQQFLSERGICAEAISAVASIELKKNEPAILALAEELRAEFRVYTAEELLELPGEYEDSAFVRRTTGVGNVCERAAAAVFPEILVHKTRYRGVTLALSMKRPRLRFPERSSFLLITGGAWQGKRRFAERLIAGGRLSAEGVFYVEEKRLQRWTEPVLSGARSAEQAAADAAEELLGELAGIKRAGRSSDAVQMSGEAVEARPFCAAIILDSIGNGVVPLRAEDRALRELGGRLACILAAQAAEVWKLECGIAERLK